MDKAHDADKPALAVLHPAGWARPRGYSNGIAATGKQVFVAGQIGWDEQCRLVSSDFAEQARQALRNVVAVLKEAGAGPQHLARMTWYLTDKGEYLAAAKAIGQAYREIVGPHYPAMTAIQVSALIEDGAKVEIEATAVVPTD
ncbi:MAG TPA: RidA family protein [Burkholderiales bacterium]|nr:RidA family protein [Burkholderiales bacterium]